MNKLMLSYFEGSPILLKDTRTQEINKTCMGQVLSQLIPLPKVTSQVISFIFSTLLNCYTKALQQSFISIKEKCKFLPFPLPLLPSIPPVLRNNTQSSLENQHFRSLVSLQLSFVLQQEEQVIAMGDQGY